MSEEIKGEDVVGTGNDARLALLNQINDANDEIRADDYQSVNDDGTTEAFVVQKSDGTKEELADEAVHEPIIDHDAETSVQLHKIKVNGVEKEVTYQELVDRAQKIAAADVYLAEASRIRQELIAKSAQQPQHQQDNRQQQLEEAKALARALQMGTEEEAAEVILRLEQKIHQAARPQDDISKTIDERLTFNEAISKFRTEYADITGDYRLNKMALEMDTEMIRNNDRRPYEVRYKEIGDSIRGWVNQFNPAAPVQDKQARKAAAPAVPKAASGKTPSSADEEKEETVSDVIADIAKNRGGPQWMRGLNQ